MIDYDPNAGALPHKKKRAKVDRSKCQHEFVETKRYSYTYLRHGAIVEHGTIRLRCKHCRKPKHNYYTKVIKEQQ